MGWRSRNSRNKEKRLTTVPAGGGSGGGTPLSTSYIDYYWRYLYVIDDGNRPSKAPIPNAADIMTYIVPAFATGSWASHVAAFAYFNGSVWAYDSDNSAHPVGTKVYVQNQYYHSSKVFILDPGGEASSYTGVEDGTTKPTDASNHIGDLNIYPAGCRSNEDIFACVIGSADHISAWLPDYIVDSLKSLWKEGVVNMTTTSPPSTPTEYSMYLIAATASGVWTGYEGHLALACADQRQPNSNRWILIKPKAGQILYDNDTDAYYWYNEGDTEWQPLASSMRFQDLSDVSGAFDSGEDGYVPTWDNGSGTLVMAPVPTGGTHNLEDHANTNFGTLDSSKDGKLIGWDNDTSRWVLYSPGGAIALNDLTDVTITTPTSNQVLQYIGGVWVNHTLVLSLEDLTNVNTSGKLIGDYLYWNGSAWVSRSIRLNDLFDVVSTAPSTGQVLTWNGSAWVPQSAPTATLPAGAGVAAALYQSSVSAPSLGSWTYTLYGSTGVTSGHPYYQVPAGYSKARITISLGVNSYDGSPVPASTPLGVKVFTSSDVLVQDYEQGVTTSTSAPGDWTSPIFPVASGYKLYPHRNSTFCNNPRYFQVELFK